MTPVARRLDHAWRVVGTGISFASFGIGGLLIGILVYPLTRLLTPDEERRRARMQRFIHHTFRFFVGLMRTLRVMDYSVSGLDELRRPGQLIVANHPTLIDVVLLISLIPETNCVVKGALLRNPFTRGPIRAAGYVANTESAALVDNCARVLAQGQSLIIFPEGTRTTPGQPPRFQRGTANIALRAGVPLRPVIIRCEPGTLTKGLPWYRVPPRRFQMTITAMPPIDTATYRAADPTLPRAARRLTSDLQDYLWRHAGGPAAQALSL